jgi:hypothetical protein
MRELVDPMELLRRRLWPLPTDRGRGPTSRDQAGVFGGSQGTVFWGRSTNQMDLRGEVVQDA